ncbi:lipopolysaccharide heptosyltransferase II [Elusimicrobiota bacterium]
MNVLIIQTAFLGDCVLTLPLINSIKRSLSCNVILLCIPSTKDVFLSCPSVDEVLVYDKKGADKGTLNMLKLVNKIREMKVDMAFLPQRSFRSGLMAFLSKIPRRIGFRRGGGKLFLTEKADFDWNSHEMKRLLSLGRTAGLNSITRESCLEPDKELVNSYRDKIAGDGKRIIGISPQSEWATKCWPVERYKELINKFREQYKFIILGRKKEDWDIGGHVIDLTGRTSIKELIAVISMLDLMVSNDTGLMHIAAALDKPVVAIFGPTVADMGFTPSGEKHSVIQAGLDCRPCSLHGENRCPEGHFKCMMDISVDTVSGEISKILEMQ